MTVIDRPLFRSVHDALRFAYTIEHQPATAGSIMLKIMNDSRQQNGFRLASDMNVNDWHAQGALIRTHIEKNTSLAEVERQYINCWYRLDPERLHDVRLLVDFTLPLVVKGALVKRRMIQALVRRLFLYSANNRPTYREIAEEYAVNESTVRTYGVRVHDAINLLEKRVMDKLTADFVRSGVVQG